MADIDAGLRYRDKVVIITGGSNGIGEGCVRTFGNVDAYIAYIHSLEF